MNVVTICIQKTEIDIVAENKVLRGASGSKGEKLRATQRKLYKKDLHTLYFRADVSRDIK
jgi:hypothetical protein